MIPPGATIGILGGGQLGRMTAMAAARLGYRCHIFAPEAAAPAAEVAAFHSRADYDDTSALEAFAANVDVVTLEFENVPASTLEFLARKKPVRPSVGVLAITQDRLDEKKHLVANGLDVAAFRPVDAPKDLESGWLELAQQAVLKTRRFGYDGKGQWMLGPSSNLVAVASELGGRAAILEARIDFEREISVIVARAPNGKVVAFPPVENLHQSHILKRTLAPAPLSTELAGRARLAAITIARSLDLEGLLAVEMFVESGDRLLINELAPRPHNSGHWTIEGCNLSQFEAHVRAICDLPLTSPELLFERVVMENLLGDECRSWAQIMEEPNAFLHLYGKRDVRADRKMGHVTRVVPKEEIGGPR